jgi:hypothetical protein
MVKIPPSHIAFIVFIWAEPLVSGAATSALPKLDYGRAVPPHRPDFPSTNERMLSVRSKYQVSTFWISFASFSQFQKLD